MKLTDEKVEGIISLLLRAGVSVSALLTLVGGILYLRAEHAAPIHYHDFHGEPSALTHVAQILKQAMALHPPAVIQAGLLLLIATPVIRVAFCVVAFLLEGDRMYVVFTLIVMATLLFSLAGSHGF